MDKYMLGEIAAKYRTLYQNAKKLIAAAELEWCPNCNGKGVIDPIENTPYKCNMCDGRGWISGYIKRMD